MRRRIPSLNSLLAFEAAARHQSITLASDELALTESAVSRQISILEEQLGVRLFNRVRKRLSLTGAGVAYARDVGIALERLERDTREVMATEGAATTLEIAVLPTVGSLWLIPRLSSFYQAHPNLTISLSSRSKRFLFSESHLDGALCFLNSTWPGAISDFLFDEVLVPVASPQLAQTMGTLAPDDLPNHRLLHLMSRPDAWNDWAAAAGQTAPNYMKGPRFEVQSMLISAACCGQGVALLPTFLIESQLQSGALKVLSATTIQTQGAYYFSFPEDKAEEPALQAFRQWLQEQTRLFREKSAPD